MKQESTRSRTRTMCRNCMVSCGVFLEIEAPQPRTRRALPGEPTVERAGPALPALEHTITPVFSTSSYSTTSVSAVTGAFQVTS